MFVPKTVTVNERLPFNEQVRLVDLQIRKILLALDRRIRFGTFIDGELGENISGTWQSFTSHATPDTEFSVAHGVGAIPQGVIVMRQDKSGTLYDGTTAWDATNAYHRSPTASVAYRVFYIK